MKHVAKWEFTLRKFLNNNLKFSTYPYVLPIYVAINMTNYFQEHYFDLILGNFFGIISLFLRFRIITE